MNKLDRQERTRIITALVEGNSVRATCRMMGSAKGTVLRLLAEIGKACAAYQESTLRNLYCRRVQCDEIWGFSYAKEKNVPKEKRGQFGYGDMWTWVALDADSKLVVCWHLGKRDAADATSFMTSLSGRLSHRIQLTTDGHRAYLTAVEDAFGNDIDYAMLVKLYGKEPETESRYSPPKCIGTSLEIVEGFPRKKHISTSYVERQNLTMQMGMRRLTRLTTPSPRRWRTYSMPWLCTSCTTTLRGSTRR